MRIDQAVYGSRSGDRDYRLLAASPGVARPERDLLEQHANLGGSALTDDVVPPIDAFFPLDARGGRLAFTRATVLGRGARGNDYLVHALVLERETIDALRGDLYLLEAAFATDKPASGDERLPQLALDVAAIDQWPHRPLGSDLAGGLALSDLGTILATLEGEGPLAVPIADGAFAAALCRSLLSVLPPDDRAAFSFCTRATQPRSLPYRFAAFPPSDRANVERYLPRSLRPLATAPSPTADRWLEIVRHGLEPAFGIGFLRDPEGAIRRAEILQALERDSAAVAGPDAAEVADLARDPRNEDLPRLTRTKAPILAGALHFLAGHARSSGLPEMLFGAVEADLEHLPPASLLDALAANPAGPARHAAELAIALAQPDDGGVPLFAADRLAEILSAAEPFAAALLARWLDRRRAIDGSARALAALSRLLSPGAPPSPALLSALERAAPAERGERPAWFVELFERLPIGERLPPAFAARVAIQEEILDRLPPGRLDSVAPALVTSLPQLLTAERLVALTDSTLDRVLAAATAGLAAADFSRSPERARLVERLAAAAAERPVLARSTVRLIGAAAARPEVAAEALGEALARLLRARPPRSTALAVRTAAVAGRLGIRRRLDPAELAPIRAQALRDARESAPSGKGWPVLIWLAALETSARGSR